jgi:glycosyltransferase involved in cell wall biosynthesis
MLAEYPLVSVIMPIRNEARYIGWSLRAVLAQDYPAGRMEVLIIDGMSDDGTRAAIRQVVGSCEQQSGGRRVALYDNPARAVPAALNIGLRNARGQVIIRVDGHCEIAPDYVRRCVEALYLAGADCAGGPIATVGETLVARGIALAQSSAFGVGGAVFRTGCRQAGYVDTLAFGAYRRDVFERIGGFDEELVRNQDDELNFRLIQSGGTIWLDPSIQSIYYSRASLRGLWRQYYQYGLYKVRVIQKRGGVAAWRHLVPVTFVMCLLASLLLALVSRRRRWALAVAGPYVLANGLASAWAARRGWLALPLLPLAFFTMHLAYGCGFLAGLWRWRTAPGMRTKNREQSLRTENREPRTEDRR